MQIEKTLINERLRVQNYPETLTLTTMKIKLMAKYHIFDIKTSINPLIPRKICPKNEIFSQCYEIWQSEQVKFVNHKYDI